MTLQPSPIQEEEMETIPGFVATVCMGLAVAAVLSALVIIIGFVLGVVFEAIRARGD